MNRSNFNFKTTLIRETFNDHRAIKCPTPQHERLLDEHVHPGGDIFTTEDGNYIDFEFQLEDFDEVELAKYVEFAENLCEKHNKHVAVYLLCPKNVNVSVKECKIHSEYDFTIKLACSYDDPCEIILNGIKNKIKNNEILDEYDLNTLHKLPLMCPKKDRTYYRVQCFKILNRIDY